MISRNFFFSSVGVWIPSQTNMASIGLLPAQDLLVVPSVVAWDPPATTCGTKDSSIRRERLAAVAAAERTLPQY